MAYNHEYPYVDPNRYNSDWILHEIRRIEGEMDDFTALNKITFSGAWDITKQYPAWTIVNVNSTTGYISTKPVPAGIDYTNTNYWQLVVDYTATMADLQNRVIALENEVQNINSRYAGNVIFISDSYGGILNSDSESYADVAARELGLTAGRYFQSHLGGIGFDADSSGVRFITLLEQISVPDASLITDILVWGGANDISHAASAISDRIQAFVTKAHQLFPNAKVTIGHPGVTWNASDGPITRWRNSLKAYRACTDQGARYAANSEWILYNSDLMANDTAHPNANGVNELGRQAALVLLSGACNVHYSITAPTVTKISTSPGDLTPYIVEMRQDNGVVTFSCNFGGDFLTTRNGTDANPITLPKSGAAPFFALPVSFMIPNNGSILHPVSVNCTLTVINTSDQRFTGACTIYADAYDPATKVTNFSVNVFTGSDLRNAGNVKTYAVSAPASALLI